MKNRKKICLAIGLKDAEAWYKKRLSDNYDFTKDVLHTNMCLDVINAEHPDIIFLAEHLSEGKRTVNSENMSVPLLVHKIRQNFKGCRIIFLAGYHKIGDNFLKTLIGMGVYDIIMSDADNKLSLSESIEMIENPKDYDYSSQFLGEIDIELEGLEGSKQNAFVERYYVDKYGNRKNLPNNTVGAIEKNTVISNNNPYHNSAESMINNVVRQQVNQQQNNYVYQQVNHVPVPYYNQTNPVQNNTKNIALNTLQNNDFDSIPALSNLTYKNTEISSQVETFDGPTTGFSDDTSILTSEDLTTVNPVFSHITFAEDVSYKVDNASVTVSTNNSIAKESVNTQLINNPMDYNTSGYREDKILYSDNQFPRTNAYIPIQQARQGKIVIVAGAVSGIGTTTTALNLAYTYAKEGKNTLLIDACIDNLSVYDKCGLKDNGYYFENMCADYEKQIPLWQMCQNKTQMQKNSERYTMYPDSLNFIQLSPYIDKDTVLPNQTETIKALASSFDYVIVDVSIKNIPNVITSFLSLADKFVVVTTQDLNILNKTKSAIDKCATLIQLYSRFIVSISRYETRISPTVNDIKEYLNPTHCIYILNDNAGFLRGTSDGIIYCSYGKKKIKMCYRDLSFFAGKES